MTEETLDTNQSSEELSIPSSIKEKLRITAGWQKGMAIIYLILLSIYGLSLLFMLMMRSHPFILVLVAFVGVAIYWSVLLLQLSNGYSRFVRSDSEIEFEKAVNAQLNLWRLTVIMFIATVLFYAVGYSYLQEFTRSMNSM